MASAGRTTTQLDIKVNARELNRLDAKLRDTFKNTKTKDFNKQLEGLTKIVEKSVSSFNKLNKELMGAREASRHYKKLADELARARKEAVGLAAALQRGRGGGGGGGGFGGGGGGGGGRTIGGGFFGGGGGGGFRGRNNLGGMPPQIKSPGLGAYGQMFSGLPIFGAAIAGLMQMQQSFYQSFTRSQKSRFNTHAFLSGTQDGFGADLGITPRTQVGVSKISDAAFAKALAKEQERVRGEISGGGLTKDRKQVVVREAVPAEYGPERTGTRTVTKSTEGKWKTITWEEEEEYTYKPLIRSAKKAVMGTEVSAWSEAQKAQLGNLKPEAVARISKMAHDGASEADLKAAVDAAKADPANLKINQDEIMAKLRAKARARAGYIRRQKRTGVADLVSVGAKFGYAKPQALQRANQMTAAFGDRVSKDQYHFGEAMRAGFGLDISSTGGLMKGLSGAYGDGAGGTGGRQGVTALLANAVKAGMGRAEVTEHLKRISTITQAQYRLGVKGMNTKFMTGNLRALTAGGITGIAASDTVTGFMKGAAEQGYGGPQGVHGYALMRAAGWDPSQGTEGYFAAQEKLQALGAGSGDASIMKKYLMQHDPGAGKGGATRRHFIQQAFKGVGVRIGTDQAEKIAAMLDKGFATGIEDDEGSVVIDDILKAGKKAQGRGDLAADAYLENKRIALGAKTAKQVRGVIKQSLDLAKVLSPMINAAMGGLNKLFEKGITGLQTLIEGIQKAITTLASLGGG